MGGVENTRLLLRAQQSWPGKMGGVDGPLGRYYMGHISGKIANIIFDDPAAISDLDFKLDASGAWIRRRFMLTANAQLQPAPRRQSSANRHSGPRAVLAEGDHIGIVGGERVDDSGHPGAAAVLDVPGEEPHSTPQSQTNAFCGSRISGVIRVRTITRGAILG